MYIIYVSYLYIYIYLLEKVCICCYRSVQDIEHPTQNLSNESIFKYK